MPSSVADASQRFTGLFPLWVALGAAAAFYEPKLFTWFRGIYITIGLGVIMLGMGVTLSIDDFRRVARMPGRVALGVIFQYTIMPTMGWVSAKLFDLSDPLAVGLILVACSPGGTASNVISYLAKADVPLSVTMTAASTLIAVVTTPLLTQLLAGSRMDIDGLGLFYSTVEVVLVPVMLGVILNRYFPRISNAILPAAPPIAVVVIVLIVASILGSSRNAIVEAGWSLLASILVLHGGGFLAGYWFARALLPKIAARTVSIEVGMQNSGLAVVLAQANFANPLVAVPGAISSFVHSALGSGLAAYWRSRSADEKTTG